MYLIYVFNICIHSKSDFCFPWAPAAGYTTVMLRNIPNTYTREMLVKQLNQALTQVDIRKNHGDGLRSTLFLHRTCWGP